MHATAVTMLFIPIVRQLLITENLIIRSSLQRFGCFGQMAFVASRGLLIALLRLPTIK